MAEDLQAARKAAEQQILRIAKWLEKIKGNEFSEEFSVRCDALEHSYKDYRSADDKLVSKFKIASTRDEFDELYLELKSKLLRHFRELDEGGKNDSDAMQELINQQKRFIEQMCRISAPATPKMDACPPPRIIIPNFSGEFKDWPSWKDLYMTAIHNKPNNEMSKAYKFQYLKGYVKGDAANLIKNIPITESNYDDAWEKLNSRFGKPKRIVTSYISRLINEPSLTKLSATGLRNIFDVCDDVIRGLRAIGSDAEKRDPWIINIVLDKLDPETQQLWANQTTEVDFPDLDMFLKFYNNRCDALESTMSLRPLGNTSKPSTQSPPFQRSVSKNQSFQKKSNIQSFAAEVSASHHTCSLCATNNHTLYRCGKFKSLTPQKRLEFVTNNKLCDNCLSAKHHQSACSSTFKCLLCGQKHNTLLHQLDRSIQTPSSQHLHANTVQTGTISKPPGDSQDTTLHCAHISVNDSSIQSALQPTVTEPCSSAVVKDTPQSSSIKVTRNFTNDDGVLDELRRPCDHAHDTTNSVSLEASVSSQSYKALLPTALVLVRDQTGSHQLCRALLDSGSEASFITEGCCQRLALHRQNANIPVAGVGSASAGVTKGLVQLNISSRTISNTALEMDALVLKSLTSKIPHTTLDVSDWTYIKTLPLADPTFFKSGPIDILIGANKFFEILSEGRILGPKGYPVAQESIFGWIISGTTSGNIEANLKPVESLLINSDASFANIDKSLRKLWETEEIPKNVHLSEEEKDCERHFLTTHDRDANGRYVLRLPFRPNRPALGMSYHAAASRQYALERKFRRNDSLRVEYSKSINDFLILGHLEEIPPAELLKSSNEVYYLPHHAVIKDSSTTTKVRPVFDASCKTTSGASLNDTLMVGPTIQRTLYSSLLKFRRHSIAFAADIEKMYRQIFIDRKDIDFQRILWRDDPSTPLKHYRLLTVTFGLSCSPYLAIRALNQLAEDSQAENPTAAREIMENFYVDDYMSGATSVSEAKDICKNLNTVLQRGGFHLRKWKCNSPDVLSSICRENEEETSLHFEDGSNITKILGIKWDAITDTFSFKVTPFETKVATKRTLLSEASKVFDPLGWLAPSIIVIKILFQRLWLEKLEWDEELPKALSSDWLTLRDEFSKFEKIKIPRCVIPDNEGGLQIHGFCDASESAYAAVVFLRCQTARGVSTNIIAAKTKVAPIKQITLPRLELCGAVLLTRLLNSIKSAMGLEQVDTFAWTDSTTVLAWLSSLPRKWKTFIANRTSEILETVPRSQWNHVKSLDNPADCASRGISPSLLSTFSLWWHGPPWLSQDIIYWPINNNEKDNCDSAMEEIRKTVEIYSATVEACPFDEIIQRYSSWSKLKRIFAFIFRFVDNAKKICKTQRQVFLSCDELRRATTLLIRLAQKSAFSEDIRKLQNKGQCSQKSPLVAFTPFLDSEGVIRVGGRLNHSAMSYDEKHPIILPKDHHITRLIIAETHRNYCHVGPTLLLALLRQKYWIIGARNLVRRHTHQCIVCYRQKAQAANQLMGDLPGSRVTSPRRAFLHVGVDYAGPITTKLKKGRGQANTTKAYIAIFVCMATKALHIEVVSDLSTEAFLATLQRFTARRGVPASIHSDNGTNFVGAHKEMREWYKLLHSEKHNEDVSNFLANNFTEWHFIPPSAPHFGGIWEASVKSTKGLLRKVTFNLTLTFEELTTLLTRIEGILNSRPLCALSDDVNDFAALTPSHFLIGEALTSIPEPSLNDIPLNRLSRWQHITAITQSFWKRWRQEYVSALQNRPKWRAAMPSLREGDLVILKEDNLPAGSWMLGRINSCQPGHDGLVRVVDVRTRSGIYRRPITKVCKLPIEEAGEGQQ